MRVYLPRVTSNPLHLMMKLLTNRNPAARSALFMAAGGLLLSPLDRLLINRENTIYSETGAESPKLILIAGPPRSGTTLVAQYLINSLHVSYINNLTSLFPGSPVVANRWLKRFVKHKTGSYHAYYGRSQGLSGVNDGLHIWDRWLGEQRDEIPTALQAGSETEIKQFFRAWIEEFGEPCVNKVNRLIGCLDLVAPVLPDAFFVYLERDPVSLAQSLLIARYEIVGDPSMNYGLNHPTRCTDDPVEDVCCQVEFYQSLQAQYESGPLRDRIFFISYDKFCANPAGYLEELQSTLPFKVKTRGIPDTSLSFQNSNSTRLPDAQMRRIIARFQEPALQDINITNNKPVARSLKNMSE